MNQMAGTPPKMLELLVQDIVDERIKGMGFVPMCVSIASDPDDAGDTSYICDGCDYQDLDREDVADDFALFVTTPATRDTPVRCELCGVWTRYRMYEDAVDAFFQWTGRLADQESLVPDHFWLGVDAAISTCTDGRGLRSLKHRGGMTYKPNSGAHAQTLEYDLFLNAVLDLDLLQK